MSIISVTKLFHRLESIIDFRVKELTAKIAVIEKFESQVKTLTEVVKHLEDKLPEALEQGINHDQPESLMVKRLNKVERDIFYNDSKTDLILAEFEKRFRRDCAKGQVCRGRHRHRFRQLEFGHPKISDRGGRIEFSFHA